MPLRSGTNWPPPVNRTRIGSCRPQIERLADRGTLARHNPFAMLVSSSPGCVLPLGAIPAKGVPRPGLASYAATSVSLGAACRANMGYSISARTSTMHEHQTPDPAAEPQKRRTIDVTGLSEGAVGALELLVSKLQGQGSAKPIASYEEWKRHLDAWMHEVAARADRYPKGFVLDDSRDAIYEGRGE